MIIKEENVAILQDKKGEEVVSINWHPKRKGFVEEYTPIAVLKTDKLTKSMRQIEVEQEMEFEKILSIEKIEETYVLKSESYQITVDPWYLEVVQKEKIKFEYFIMPGTPIYAISENDWSIIVATLEGNEEEYPPFLKDKERKIKESDPINKAIEYSTEPMAERIFKETMIYEIIKLSDNFYRFKPKVSKFFSYSLDLFFTEDYLVISGPNFHAIVLHYYKDSYKFLKTTSHHSHLSQKITTDELIRKYDQKLTKQNLFRKLESIKIDDGFTKEIQSKWLVKIDNADFSDEWKVHKYLVEKWEELPFYFTHDTPFNLTPESYIEFTNEKRNREELFWYLKAFVYHFEKIEKEN